MKVKFRADFYSNARRRNGCAHAAIRPDALPGVLHAVRRRSAIASTRCSTDSQAVTAAQVQAAAQKISRFKKSRGSRPATRSQGGSSMSGSNATAVDPKSGAPQLRRRKSQQRGPAAWPGAPGGLAQAQRAHAGERPAGGSCRSRTLFRKSPRSFFSAAAMRWWPAPRPASRI